MEGIKHNEDKNQFELEKEGKLLAFIHYRLDEGSICVTHTEVDESLRGQGIGVKLVDRLTDFAEQRGLHISSECSYARHILLKQKNSGN